MHKFSWGYGKAHDTYIAHRYIIHLDLFFHQVFANIKQATTRENSFKLIFSELVHACTTGDDPVLISK